MSRIGIIGAGKLGTALARLALDAGHEVRISGSPRQAMIELVIGTVLPGAQLLPEADVIAQSDVVILAIPFGKAHSVDFDALAGKVVVDAMNAWEAAGGHLDEDHDGTTSSLVKLRNPEMRLVKSLNHLGYLDLTADAREAGHPLRRAIGVVSDDEEARRVVARLVDSMGFEPVEGPRSASRCLEPGSPIFGRPVSAEELREALGL
ncbi:NAD(P)-binding domain-containing protein [Tessaracoccus lubricantis]|uniref:NAD(P)-binding domain-containing protein n=1 Tax=Tessaracoccus lubricantis TaxID=545543 RepID=A0ABP9FIH4_9ACTN